MSSAAERVTDGHHLYSPERARQGAGVVQRLARLRDAVGWDDELRHKPGGWELPADVIADCLPLLVEEEQGEYRRIANAAADAHLASDLFGELISRDSILSVSGDIDNLLGICVKLHEAGYEVPAGLRHENKSAAWEP